MEGRRSVKAKKDRLGKVFEAHLRIREPIRRLSGKKELEPQARKARKSDQTSEQMSRNNKCLLCVTHYMSGAVPIILFV